jgi:hypothetical protein
LAAIDVHPANDADADILQSFSWIVIERRSVLLFDVDLLASQHTLLGGIEAGQEVHALFSKTFKPDWIEAQSCECITIESDRAAAKGGRQDVRKRALGLTLCVAAAVKYPDKEPVYAAGAHYFPAFSSFVACAKQLKPIRRRRDPRQNREEDRDPRESVGVDPARRKKRKP